LLTRWPYNWPKLAPSLNRYALRFSQLSLVRTDNFRSEGVIDDWQVSADSVEKVALPKQLH